MITSTERHKLVSSRERGKRVITADIDFRVVEECCAVITAPFLVEAAANACGQILALIKVGNAEWTRSLHLILYAQTSRYPDPPQNPPVARSPVAV